MTDEELRTKVCDLVQEIVDCPDEISLLKTSKEIVALVSEHAVEQTKRLY